MSATPDGAAGHRAELLLSGLLFLVKLHLSELRWCMRIVALMPLGLGLLPWSGLEVERGARRSSSGGFSTSVNGCRSVAVQR